jgi:hypothetical protein
MICATSFPPPGRILAGTNENSTPRSGYDGRDLALRVGDIDGPDLGEFDLLATSVAAMSSPPDNDAGDLSPE